MRNVHIIAEDIAEKKGWDTETLLDHVLDYVCNQKCMDVFEEYLEECDE